MSTVQGFLDGHHNVRSQFAAIHNAADGGNLTQDDAARSSQQLFRIRKIK